MIDFGIITSNRFVQLTSSEKGGLGKEPLTQRIDSTISQTSGLSAQSVTGTEIRVTGLDENSFRTLHISILQKTNRAELTLGAAIHPPTLTHGEFRGFLLKFQNF